MIFSKRRACIGRLTIGRSKEGLPLVGFKYRKADDWLDLNLKQEGVRLEGFKYQKGYDWLDLNSNQEGVRLVGFKYQKGYDWLDSQFHCSYLESRGRHFRSKLYYYCSIWVQLLSFAVDRAVDRAVDQDRKSRDRTGSDVSHRNQKYALLMRIAQYPTYWGLLTGSDKFT
jgi:hypothetical protein